jgi:peptide/nickel transport system substrate-binding protein
MPAKGSAPAQRDLTRRDLGLGAATALALGALRPGAARAADAVDRSDTLIIEAWPAGTTFKNYNNMNPFAVGNDLRNHIVFILEPLFFWSNLTASHIPWLGTSYSYNADFTQVTVKLREGVTWSDKAPFTADDVVYTFEMLRQNGEGKQDLFFATDMASFLKSAEKIDDHTVLFTLKQRDPRFVLRTLTVKFNAGIFIVPKHAFATTGDPASFPNYSAAGGIPVGTGAYRIADAAPERILLDRRDDWWGAKPEAWGPQRGAFYATLPEPKRLITVPRGDQQQSAEQLAAKRFDWSVEAPVPIMKKLLADYPFITTLTDRKPPWGNVDWWPTSVFCNFDSPKLQDKNVRLALRYAVNPQQVIDIFDEGAADLSFTPFPDFKALHPYIEDLAPVAKAHEMNVFDLKKSAALMQQAGYAKDGDGFWAKDGTRWTATLYGNPAVEQIGPIVTAQLRRGGFSVSWNLPPDYLQPVYGGKADLILWGHNGGIFDPQDTMLLYYSKFYRPVGQITTRFARYRNKRFDELTDQVGTYPPNDPAIRPLVKEAMTIWMDDVVEIPIQQWYHRIPFSTAYWTNWPSEANPYAPPTVSHWSTILVVNGLKKQQKA